MLRATIFISCDTFLFCIVFCHCFLFFIFSIHSSLHRPNPSGQPQRPRREQEERGEEGLLLSHQEAVVAVHASQADAHPQEDPHPQEAPVTRALPHPQEDGRHGHERLPRGHLLRWLWRLLPLQAQLRWGRFP